GELEYKLSTELRERIAARTGAIQATARRLAQLDVLAALAHVAAERGWTKPAIDRRLRIEIKGGRHPVVEALTENGAFVPNDTLLDENQRLDRKSTRLNSSHVKISYAVFCLKKKKEKDKRTELPMPCAVPRAAHDTR